MGEHTSGPCPPEVGVCSYVLLLQPRVKSLARAVGVDYTELCDTQPCQMVDNGPGVYPA